MSSFGTRLEGDDRVNLKLAFMQDQDAIIGGIQTAAKFVRGVAKVYPPGLSWSTYKRTYNLSNNWRYRTTGWGATITNNTDYGPYVQGEKQTTQHAMTGWRTTEEIAEVTREDVITIIRDSIKKVLEK